MSLIQIEGYDDFLDTDLGVIRNPKGNIIGGVPIGAFAYKGKLYGEGTIVELNYGGKRKAVFEKEPNEQHESWREDYYQFREVKDGGYIETMPYFSIDDPEPEEIIKIVKAVEFNAEECEDIQSPPIDNGHKTPHKNPQGITTEYFNQLWQCTTDINGNITGSVDKSLFWHGKYLYKIGTEVIIRKVDSIYHKPRYVKAFWNGKEFKPIGRGGGAIFHLHELEWAHMRWNIDSKTPSIAKIVAITYPIYHAPEGQPVSGLQAYKLDHAHKAPVDTFTGTIIYILAMVIGTIFKARIAIWIIATIIYFLWKWGGLSKNK